MKKGLLFFLAGLFCLIFSAYADDTDDLIAATDRQMAFVNNVFKNLEREQLKREAERQAELSRHVQSEKTRREAILTEQFSGLSSKLSGLPAVPKFEGRFESIPVSSEEEKEAKS